MKYHVGCSGYYYPQWKNKFYPPGMQAKNWLRHYSSVFNSVELNGTFYRMPSVENLKKNASVTPRDFTFSVKMSRLITHIHRLKDKQAISDFQNQILEGLENKLMHFLFQMPPSFQYSEQNLERIVTNIPNYLQNVIEFRHLSWWNDTTAEALKQANLTFCNVDFPGLNSYAIHTTSAFYFRFHGNPELFISSYNLEQLKDFHQKLPVDASSYTVYFNNTMYEAGYGNALQLMKMIHA